MKLARTETSALAMLGLVMLLWAGNSIVGRAVRFDVPPFTLAFGRWAGAFLILLPFAVGAVRRDWAAILQGWKAVLLLGLLGVAAFNAFLYLGLQYTTATNALLLQAAIPALVVILDRLVFGNRASRWQTAGTVLSILGVVVIVFEGDPAAALRLHFGLGDVLVLASVAVWSAYTVFLRLRPAIEARSFIAATFFIGMVAMAPLAVMEWARGSVVNWTPMVIGGFAYVAVLPSLVSYFIYNSAAQTLGPARAGQAITMMPIFGAFLSAALLGEALHWWHFAGMGLIVAGIVLGAMSLLHKSSAGAAGAARLEGKA
jgi:drug/metabolite transporter (DMT)-like permease